MKQTILTRHELNECTIRHDRGNLSFINLSDLRNSDDSLDRLDSRVDRSLIRAGDLDLSYAVYLIDRYRSSRFLLDTLDDLTARADYRTDEFLTDNHRLDTRCMRFQILTSFRLSLQYLAQDMHTTLFSLSQSILKDLVRQTVYLDIHLGSRDTVFRTRYLEVHITQVILVA